MIADHLPSIRCDVQFPHLIFASLDRHERGPHHRLHELMVSAWKHRFQSHGVLMSLVASGLTHTSASSTEQAAQKDPSSTLIKPQSSTAWLDSQQFALWERCFMLFSSEFSAGDPAGFCIHIRLRRIRSSPLKPPCFRSTTETLLYYLDCLEL